MKESSFKRWLKYEIGRMNSSVVTKQKALKELFKEEKPTALTKDGSVHYFDKSILLDLKNLLPDELHELKLPITFYNSIEDKNNSFLTDITALSMLKHLDEVLSDAELVEGRYWMSKALARDLIRRYPTLFQIVTY